MSKLTIVCGISGAGKSTYTLEHIRKNPGTVRLNRDSLRESLTGKSAAEYNRKPENHIEKLINKISTEIVSSFVYEENEYRSLLGDVIADNTHLKKSFINDLKGRWKGEVELVLIDCPPELAKARAAVRDGYIDHDYIDRQYAQLQTLKQVVKFDKIICT